jgi:hypothetical protein
VLTVRRNLQQIGRFESVRSVRIIVLPVRVRIVIVEIKAVRIVVIIGVGIVIVLVIFVIRGIVVIVRFVRIIVVGGTAADYHGDKNADNEENAQPFHACFTCLHLTTFRASCQLINATPGLAAIRDLTQRHVIIIILLCGKTSGKKKRI